MKSKIAVIAALISTAAIAQGPPVSPVSPVPVLGQQLCGRADITVPASIDEQCMKFGARWYTDTDSEGIEEDAIIGVQSVDVTLTNADIDALATTQYELVPAPGPDKYLLVDWIVIIKTDPDGVSTSPAPGAAWVLATVAPAGVGLITQDANRVFLVFAGGLATSTNLWTPGRYVRRYLPGGIGGSQESTADTPLILGVSVGRGQTAAQWTAITDDLDDTVTLRFIIRFRVIDTTYTFEEGTTP